MSENKTYNILLVEDDQLFRRVIAKNLARHNFVVREVENGMVAEKLLQAEPGRFHVVISDIRMPEMDGVALLKSVRKSSKVPFIMMTGFSELLESKAAYELGANGFLPKPLKTEALLEAIQSCLFPGQQKPVKMRKFKEIPIEDFFKMTHLPADLFLRLGPEHHVKVAHEGEKISHERLKVYQQNKKVTHLYMLEDIEPAPALMDVRKAA